MSLGVLRPALWAGAAVAAGALVWGSVIERNAFTLRRVIAPVLPPGASPLRVLHLSDMHLAPWQSGKSSWVSALAELEPDLVVNTGDNYGHVDALPLIRQTLSAFDGIPGVFVNGSNDYFGPEFKNPFLYFAGPSGVQHHARRVDTAALTNFFQDDLGWLSLNNHAVSMSLRDMELIFMGVDDPHRHFDSVSKMSRSLDELQQDLQFAQASPVTINIGVTHAPYQRILNSFVDRQADIIFAGHTHGGQVCVPGYGALVTNCDIPRKQVKGLSWWTHANRTAGLHISAGIGTSIYAPVRFACAPEASIVTLTARS